MMNDTDTPATPNPDVVTLPNTQVVVPCRLELPVQIDTNGRVWPVGGLTRLTRVPLATLLEHGVTVQWRMPDGTVLDQETGSLLVASRQADMDKGYRPVFEEAVPAPPAPVAPDPKL